MDWDCLDRFLHEDTHCRSILSGVGMLRLSSELADRPGRRTGTFLLMAIVLVGVGLFTLHSSYVSSATRLVNASPGQMSRSSPPRTLQLPWPPPYMNGTTTATFSTVGEFLERCDWMDSPDQSPLPFFEKMLGTKAAAADGAPPSGSGSSAQQSPPLHCVLCSTWRPGAPLDVARILQALNSTSTVVLAGNRQMEQEQSCVVCPPDGNAQKECRKGPGAGNEHQRIGILIGSGGNISYLPLSLGNKYMYAARHGYGLHILPTIDHSRMGSWSKIPGALSLLPLYDWMWFVDMDTLIMTPSVPITDYIDEAFDMIVGSDCNGINMGSFLLRSTQWVEALLIETYTRPNTHPLAWMEQAALMVMQRELPGMNRRIKVIPQNGLNSYGPWSADSCGGDGALWKPGDLLQHMPGTGTNQKDWYEAWSRMVEADRIASIKAANYMLHTQARLRKASNSSIGTTLWDARIRVPMHFWAPLEQVDSAAV